MGHYYPRLGRYRNGGAGGGGGGGAITVQGAANVTIGEKGRITANGGDGGGSSGACCYYPGSGGGGAGGSVLIRATSQVVFETGAVLDVAGGQGGTFTGTFTRYAGGDGGQGGSGYIRLEASENPKFIGNPLIDGLDGAVLTYKPASSGIFAPRGGGAPSIGQSRWVNLGVFDPQMARPATSDIAATLLNDRMVIEVQMAVEDENNLGQPDLTALDLRDEDGDGEFGDTLDSAKLSEWVPVRDIDLLNGRGYRLARIRVSFQLDDNQEPDHALPSLSRLRLPFSY